MQVNTDRILYNSISASISAWLMRDIFARASHYRLCAHLTIWYRQKMIRFQLWFCPNSVVIRSNSTWLPFSIVGNQSNSDRNPARIQPRFDWNSAAILPKSGRDPAGTNCDPIETRPWSNWSWIPVAIQSKFSPIAAATSEYVMTTIEPNFNPNSIKIRLWLDGADGWLNSRIDYSADE